MSSHRNLSNDDIVMCGYLRDSFKASQGRDLHLTDMEITEAIMIHGAYYPDQAIELFLKIEGEKE